MATSTRTPRGRQRRGSTRPALLSGAAALGLVKTADAVTTLLGLTRLPGAVERNPVVAALISEAGLLAGLALMVVGSVLLVTLLIETLSTALFGRNPRARRQMRAVGFGTATLVSALPVVLNALQLVEHGILF